jgi:hypothetical protein
MIRWRVTELGTNEQPLRFYTDRLADAKDLVYLLGRRWRLERQFRYSSGWRRDGERGADFELEYRIREGS